MSSKAGPGSRSIAQEPNQDLHQQSKNAGGKLVLRYLPDRSVIYPNIEELAQRSDLIIVGRLVLPYTERTSLNDSFSGSLWLLPTACEASAQSPGASRVGRPYKERQGDCGWRH